MTTYGVYSKDLLGVSISKVDLETAKEYCYADHVVCSEKYKTTGFSLRITFSKYWDFAFRPRWNVLNLGFLQISWETERHLWADKIVWKREAEGEPK